jgi:hypothetical protein
MPPQIPTFEWYGVESVGKMGYAGQHTVRRRTGSITFEKLGDSWANGRFNPPEGHNLAIHLLPGGLTDTGFWNAAWHQPHDFYAYINDAKEGLCDDISAGRRVFRSLPSMTGEWDELRALWVQGPPGDDDEAAASSSWGLRALRPGESRPPPAIGREDAVAEAWWREEEAPEGGRRRGRWGWRWRKRSQRG